MDLLGCEYVAGIWDRRTLLTSAWKGSAIRSRNLSVLLSAFCRLSATIVAILLSSERKKLGSPEASYSVEDGHSAVQTTETDKRKHQKSGGHEGLRLRRWHTRNASHPAVPLYLLGHRLGARTIFRPMARHAATRVGLQTLVKESPRAETLSEVASWLRCT